MLPITAAAAQDHSSPEKDWNFYIGAGAMYMPAFLGSKDYQFISWPEFGVTWKDKFFVTSRQGAGYNIINSNGWRMGPVIKNTLARKENGAHPLRMAGRKTEALQGLGDVRNTVEFGGFSEYTWNNLSAKIELRQGINGHHGLISDIDVIYTHDIPLAEKRTPLTISFGPHATAVDSSYNETYFGVNSVQSARSGLPQYNAKGGLLKYGVSFTTTVPITDNLHAIFMAGYDRLSGDAASAPLIKQRGTRNQSNAGVMLTYAL